jgi:periplasmic protein TonB
MKRDGKSRDSVLIITFIVSLIFHLALLSVKMREPAAHNKVIHKITLVRDPEPVKEIKKPEPENKIIEKKPVEPEKIVKKEPPQKEPDFRPPEPVIRHTPQKQDIPRPQQTAKKTEKAVVQESSLKEIGSNRTVSYAPEAAGSKTGEDIVEDAKPGPVEVPAPPPPEPPKEVALKETYVPAGGRISPGYPEDCRERGEEGTVIIEVEILPDGRAGNVVVTGSSGYSALDRVVVNTARSSYYTPAQRNGVSVVSFKRFVVNFNLEDYY